MSAWAILGATASVAGYLFALNKRLTTPNPLAYAHTTKPLTDDDLAEVTVPTPQDMADAMKAHGPATGKAYLVIGGSGLVGQYIARTLLARGETLVRIIDIVKPKAAANSDDGIDSLARAEFIQADMADYRSISEAISRPFGNTGRTAEAVIHTAAVIRNFERLGYLKDLSYRVNVEGTKNVLKASQELGTVGSFVYTSSAGIFTPPGNFLRLGLGNSRRGVVFGDDVPTDAPKTRNHYISTKIEAEMVVRAADGVKGVRTGVLRPGMAIMGPESLFTSFVLDNPGVNPTWGGGNMNSMVNAWDLGRAHVLLSDALFNQPEDVAGQSFAITGQATVHPLSEARRMMQFYSRRDLQFREVSELMMYIFSYFVEAALLARYLILKSASYITGSQVARVPRWAVTTKLMYIQPAMWDFSVTDTIVDDSRARKVLGYNSTLDQPTMPLTFERTLALRGFLLAAHITAASARRWTVNNDCPFTIWPAIYTSNTSAVTLNGVETGWEAAPNSSRSFVVPEGWTGGYIWGRRDCNFSSGNNPQDTNTTVGGCVSGGCSGGLYCTSLGAAPITHAEWTLAPGDGSGADYYDISIDRGFNLPMQVVPSAMGCGIAECAVDLNANCPDPLRGPFAANTNNTVPIGCKSACTANLDGNPDNSGACCTGQFAAQGACPTSGVPFYDYFKQACPFTYAYSQDVTSGTSLQTCAGSSYPDYTVTFCPPSVLANSTTTQSGAPVATSGTITGIPSMTGGATNTLTSSRSLGTSLIPSNANSASALPIMQTGLVLGLITSLSWSML